MEAQAEFKLIKDNDGYVFMNPFLKSLINNNNPLSRDPVFRAAFETLVAECPTATYDAAVKTVTAGPMDLRGRWFHPRLFELYFEKMNLKKQFAAPVAVANQLPAVQGGDAEMSAVIRHMAAEAAEHRRFFAEQRQLDDERASKRAKFDTELEEKRARAAAELEEKRAQLEEKRARAAAELEEKRVHLEEKRARAAAELEEKRAQLEEKRTLAAAEASSEQRRFFVEQQALTLKMMKTLARAAAPRPRQQPKPLGAPQPQEVPQPQPQPELDQPPPPVLHRPVPHRPVPQPQELPPPPPPAQQELPPPPAQQELPPPSAQQELPPPPAQQELPPPSAQQELPPPPPPAQQELPPPPPPAQQPAPERQFYSRYQCVDWRPDPSSSSPQPEVAPVPIPCEVLRNVYGERVYLLPGGETASQIWKKVLGRDVCGKGPQINKFCAEQYHLQFKAYPASDGKPCRRTLRAKYLYQVHEVQWVVNTLYRAGRQWV